MNFNAPLKKLDDVDLPRIGAEIGCGEDELHAVLEVETSGGAADSKGRLKMLFEPHVFYRCLPANKRVEAQRVFVNINGKSWAICYPNWRSGYPSDSYPRLMRAMEIDETAALKACSWGLPQILGENHKAAGYGSPQEMVKDFTLDEDNHIEAMIRFIKVSGMARALQRHDWAAFASRYNGPKYAVHNYHGRLAASFAKWQRIKDTPWDRNAATLTIGDTTVDTRSGDLGETKAAPVAPVALPMPGAKPDSPAEVKQLGLLGTIGALIAAAWQTIAGSGALRVAIVVLILGAFYWLLVRPLLRRMGVLDRFYGHIGKISFIGKVRLAAKGAKQFLWGRVLALVPLAVVVLEYAEVIPFSAIFSYLPNIGPITPEMYGTVLGGGLLAYVNNWLRKISNTPAGATDLNMAPEMVAPPLVSDQELPAFFTPIEPKAEREKGRRLATGKRRLARVRERVRGAKVKIRKRARA